MLSTLGLPLNQLVSGETYVRQWSVDYPTPDFAVISAMLVRRHLVYILLLIVNR